MLREESVVILHQDFQGGRVGDVQEDNDRVLRIETIVIVSLSGRLVGVSAAVAVLSFMGMSMRSVARSLRGGLDAEAANSARVFVGLAINTANWAINFGALTVLGKNRFALTFVEDLNALLAVDSASVLVGTAIRAADRAVVLGARRAGDLGGFIHASSVVGLLDVGALQQALVSVGLLVETANREVEVVALALTVAGAGTGLVKFDLSALEVALVVVGDAVLAADELGVSSAVRAVLEIVGGALTLVEESLTLASQNTFVLEGLVVSGADRLVDGSATTGAEASSLGGDTDIGAKSDALVLVGDVVVTANGSEVVFTGALDSEGGNNEVGGSTRSRADSVDAGLDDQVAEVLVGDTVITADRIVNGQAFYRISCFKTVSGIPDESRVSNDVGDLSSRAETIGILGVAQKEGNTLVGEGFERIWSTGRRRRDDSQFGANWAVSEEAEGQGGVGQLIIEALVVGIVLLKSSAVLEGEGGQQHKNDRFVKHYKSFMSGLKPKFKFFRIFEFENRRIQI